jgi:hypothetical protein
MSFWMGFAKAFKDSDDKKTEDRRIQEQRDFLQSEKADDRKWQEDFFFRKLSAETEEQRKTMLLQGGGGRRSAGGGSGGSAGGMSLQALVTRFPQLDPEIVANLAPFPDKIEEVYNALSDSQQSHADARVVFPAESLNNFIRDVVPEDGELSSERIQELAQAYGVDPASPVTPDSRTTWEDAIRQTYQPEPSATVIYDPAALPAPMKPEAIRLYQEQIKSRLDGYLSVQTQQLRAEFGNLTDPTGNNRNNAAVGERGQQIQEEISRIEALADQVSKGFIDEALNSEYGTRAVQDIWNAGITTDYRQMFPMFQPHFASPEQAEAALTTGFIKPGQRIKVLVDGVYKTARF